MTEFIHPLHYRLEITPDLEQFRFSGRVSVDLTADRPVTQVSLNLLELAVWRCRLKKEDTWKLCAFSLSPEKETLTVILPEPCEHTFQIEIEYDGRINNQMSGFYRSKYVKDGQVRHIAVTQFQESSARQAFPCMDHPGKKATFDLIMNVPVDLRAIANMPVVEDKIISEDVKQVVFERTPIMSTYLLFFGVGEFEIFQDDIDKRVRLVALPGLKDTTALGLAFGRTALRYCEQYYAIDYPLAKMDLIAVPDFAFGAMENWGAITFRENLLLHFPETTSGEGVERICEVIAHEIAHQWFGNLVTPADWKYLWLNESFATYFGYGVVAHAHPEWGTWDQFLHAQTATALNRDGLKATFPIEIPGGEHVVINSSTAPIIYNKGASMLRMIEGYIGAQRYRQGVRTYLRNHTYGCAESRHLWEAFESAADMPITDMVQNWIGQPGFPLVSAQRNGTSLQLRQCRFTFLPKDFEQIWKVPINLICWTRSGEHHEQTLIMEDEAISVDLPSDLAAYKLNYGQSGFYRVAYDDEENLAALGRKVLDGSMQYLDRWGLQNDIFALVKAGRMDLESYLGFLRFYENEKEYLPLISIAGHMQYAYMVGSPSMRDTIADIGAQLCRRVLTTLGMTPIAGEAHTLAALRNQLLWQAAGWNVSEATDFGVSQFQEMMAGKAAHPDIARSVMKIGANEMGPEALEWFKNRLSLSPSEHERMNVLAGLTAFGDWALIEEALAYVLDKVPPRNKFIPIAAAAGNPVAAPHMWEWYRNNIERLETFHPLLYERVITGVVPVGGLNHEADVQAFFESYVEQRPNLKDAVELALEHLEINSRIR